MTLAYRKEFQDAGFRREDTTIAIVWAAYVDDDPERTDQVVVYSECRDGLSDHRPQEEHEPCGFYHFDGTMVHGQGSGKNPLEALRGASELLARLRKPSS